MNNIGVKENKTISATYVKNGREIAEKQIVLAGHRLAKLLKSLKLDDFDVNNYMEERELENFLNDPRVQSGFDHVEKGVESIKKHAKKAYHYF